MPRRISAACALTLLFAAAAPAQFHLSFDKERRIWSISNGLAAAEFQLTPQDTFVLRSLADLSGGGVWTPPSAAASSIIRLRTDAAAFDETSRFRLVRQSAQSGSRSSYRHTIELEDEHALGRFLVELEMYEGHPVLRYRVRFQNIRPQPVRVVWADMLSWRFDDRGKSFRILRVNQWVRGGSLGNFEPVVSNLSPNGRPVELTAGAWGQHCSWMALRDEEDRGLIAGWEFDGMTTASARYWPGGLGLELSASIPGLSRTLQPREYFRVPAAFLGVYRGDWDEAGYRTQRFAEAALARPMPDQGFPYVVWDSWKYQTHIDETTLRRNAQIAADLGVEVFVVDLGWARQIGDWREDPAKFPSGLRALSDFVHSLGMKFGLHLPLAEASPTAPVLLANPDWRSSETYHYFNADSLCLSHRPVREWIIRQVTRIIDDYGVDWILQDGENMVKMCVKSTHTHAPGDSNYSNAVDGLNAVVETMLARRPAVHWENCEDGGAMMTYNMVRNYVTSITADDSGPMTTRQAVYGVTYPFPPRYADRYMPDEELGPYITRSFMFGGPWILMTRLASMREQDLEFLAKEIALFKSLRTHIRDGKVLHLTARPAENRIDAIASYRASTDSAIAFVFRPEAPAASYRVRLNTMNPEAVYRVRFQEDRRLLTMTGRQIIESGIRVNLPAMWSCDIVYVEPVSN